MLVVCCIDLDFLLTAMAASTEHKGQSGIDLSKFKALFKDERKNLVFMARTAETAERYDGMCWAASD